MTARAIRGAAITFVADPFLVDPAEALVHIDDALILIEDGRIVSVGAFAAAEVPAGVPVEHYPDALLASGFIDTHVHYSQLEMVGAFGARLLEWLERYTFPAELRFADKAHADRVAALFLRELLRNGTTTACVHCTVHPQSVDAFFEESERFNTRMIAGKVLMDRNAPAGLTDTPERGYAESKALIERWHGRGRQLYCITPRFAPTSTPAQLEAAGRLWREHPTAYVQTHLSEDAAEVAWVRELFPEADNYLDVYHRAGLTGRRAIFAHGIHLDEDEFCLCHRTGSALSHCPTSNLFLGSGLFRAFEAKRADRPVFTGLGTDVGGGTSLSQLQTLNEAYKVAALNATAGRGEKLRPAQAFYLATRGGAEALALEDTIGSLAPGCEADIVVLDLKASPLVAFRLQAAPTIEDKLFALMTLADERTVRATYVAGEKAYDRDAAEPFRHAR
ncbi:guanine deaminase [Labrys wisconsinensis]|uniref:Guanine deaminase n=1 Tax=Labrys wisconsinensis TaxID=425677 RepID=A0ABU0J633_9HYPH|nr:guanine deaminase [Labrys wisconsinensis]MDQ0469720.1 guanine deaminase [Labrys wisconsinensis]